MFYIGYKSDYKTACRKQLNGAEYAGTAANGAEVYSIVPDLNWPDHRAWYYTVNGGMPGLCKELRCSPYLTPEMMREQLANITEEQAAKIFLDKDGELDRIKTAIEAGTWTSNADALLCELCGKPDLAAKVRANRAAYKARQAKEEQQRAAEEEQRRKTEAEAEQKRKTEELEQAERDLRAGKYITAAHFEQLAERYGVNLPIKLVGWLREHCGSIRLKADADCGGYFTQYYYDKGHKSTSIGTYGDKLGRAMAI